MFGKKIKKTISVVCAMAIAFTCLASGAFASEKAAYEPTKSPKIEFFKTSSDNVEPGNTVNLSWRVLGATSVVITGEEKEIECILEDSIEVWPMVTTVYTLHAYGFGSEVTSSVTVKVGAAEINSFTATPTSVAPGENVTLAWDVYNAESVIIKEIGDKELLPQGSLVVNPYVDTTYTLVAKGYDGAVVYKQIDVKVKAPIIVSFEADKTVIAPGEDVTLKWEVNNAESIIIKEIGDKELLPQGSLVVNPYVDTTYTLVAKGYDGSVISKQVDIKVKAPVIVSFETDKTEIAPGEDVTLKWDVNNAESIIIKEIGDKELLPQGSLVVNPFVDTTYTLVAKGYDGVVISKQVDIKVKAPVIVSFETDKTEVVPGDTVILSWNVLYAKELRIIGVEKDQEVNIGSIEVWPLTTTTYILEVEGFDGSIINKELTVSVKSPLITSFTASKTTITKGEMIKLSWTTKNAVKCSIVTSQGQKLAVPVNSSISLTPNKDIIFTLIAVDEEGNKAEKSIKIIVNK